MERANRPMPTLIEEIAMNQEDRIDMLAALVRDLIDYLEAERENYEREENYSELAALLQRAQELVS